MQALSSGYRQAFAGRTTISAYSPKFTINDPIVSAPSWNKLIAADLIREMEFDISERLDSIPEMRPFLAIKGYRQLHMILAHECQDKTGAAALKAMALVSRAYAKQRPGLSAATFRTPILESEEWMEASKAVTKLFIPAFTQCGLDEVAAVHGIRMLRCLVRGFVVNEMSGSFYASSDYDESYELAIDVFIRGLPALMRDPRQRDFKVVSEPFSVSNRSVSTDELWSV